MLGAANYSKSNLVSNIQRMISSYNAEVGRYKAACAGLAPKQYPDVGDFIDTDPTKISWGVNLKQGLAKFKTIEFSPDAVTQSLYRPFTKRWLYFVRKSLNHSLYRMPLVFPSFGSENLVICVSGIGARSGFSTIITNCVPNYDTLEKALASRCTPMATAETILKRTIKGHSLMSHQRQVLVRARTPSRCPPRPLPGWVMRVRR